MSNYDFSSGTAGSGLYKVVESSGYILRKHVINFADAVTVKGSPLAAGDTIDILSLNVGEFVDFCSSRVITAGTAASTATVGDQSSAAGLIASVACDAVTGTLVPGSGALLQNGLTPFNILGKYYTAANTVRLTLGATPPQTGVIEFVVGVIQIYTHVTI